MNYEIVELKEKKVVGVIKKTTNENMQSVKEIGEVWTKFIGEGIYEAIKNKVDTKAIGLYTDYEKDCTKPYNFMACCEVRNVEKLEENLRFKVINAGKYAKFSVRGNMQKAVSEAWMDIWKLDLNRKYDSDFEIYHYNSENMNDQIIDIYVSIV